jgi:hypothetical protein
MRGFAYISMIMVALNVSACSGEVGDSGVDDEAEAAGSISEALTFPAGFGFRTISSGAAGGTCLDLLDCYLPHDKKVDWVRTNEGSTGASGVFLSDLVNDEVAYQRANAPGWTILKDSAAGDTIQDVAIPGLEESRMIPSGQIDNPNNPNPPGGKRHMFHRCRIEIDLGKIGTRLAGSSFDQVSSYAHNVLRREMFACLGLGLRSGGPMVPGRPGVFVNGKIEVTAAQKTMLQQYAP